MRGPFGPHDSTEHTPSVVMAREGAAKRGIGND
jgi:hypothetical protein